VSDGTTTISVKYIFEQYYKHFTPTLKKKNISGNIIQLFGNLFTKANVSNRKPIFSRKRGTTPVRIKAPARNPVGVDISIMIDNKKAEFENKLEGKNIKLQNMTVDQINTLTAALEEYRIEKKRIKETPNNPVSSRSHLYIVFEITFEDKTKGYVTIVDTAGRESPTGIFESYIDTSQYPLTKLEHIITSKGNEFQAYNTILDKMKETEKEKLLEKAPKLEDITFQKDEKMAIAKYKWSAENQRLLPAVKDIYEIFKEGFYINETINHLMYYFDRKNFKPIPPKFDWQSTEIKDYKDSKYYVNPSSEEKNMLEKDKNCLMIPILNKLDQLNKSLNNTSYKPTKFITMVCVRQDIPLKKDNEQKKIDTCDQTIKSLQFAVQIKSS
jgi:hypothetical protein